MTFSQAIPRIQRRRRVLLSLLFSADLFSYQLSISSKSPTSLFFSLFLYHSFSFPLSPVYCSRAFKEASLVQWKTVIGIVPNIMVKLIIAPLRFGLSRSFCYVAWSFHCFIFIVFKLWLPSFLRFMTKEMRSLESRVFLDFQRLSF